MTPLLNTESDEYLGIYSFNNLPKFQNRNRVVLQTSKCSKLYIHSYINY